MADAVDLARIRASEFYRAHRPVPSDPGRRARLLEAILNRSSSVTGAVVGIADLPGARDAVLVPYVRHRLAEAAAAARALGDLRPIEVAVLADCLLSLWDFAGIAAALPAWTEAVAGTPFARRIDQTGRRAALRLGRLGDAARGIEAIGDDLGALVLRGDVLDAVGRMDEARDAYEAAVRRDGTDPGARLSHGFHLMKSGQIRDGLASWSVADALLDVYPLRRHRPHWTGEPLGRRRLMVLFEHGLGDMIQVARFLPRLLEREPDATVLARVPAPLAGLMARAFPRIRFVTEDGREPGLRPVRPLDAARRGARRSGTRAAQPLHRPRRPGAPADRCPAADRDLLARAPAAIRGHPLHPARHVRGTVRSARCRFRRPPEPVDARGDGAARRRGQRRRAADPRFPRPRRPRGILRPGGHGGHGRRASRRGRGSPDGPAVAPRCLLALGRRRRAGTVVRHRRGAAPRWRHGLGTPPRPPRRSASTDIVRLRPRRDRTAGGGGRPVADRAAVPRRRAGGDRRSRGRRHGRAAGEPPSRRPACPSSRRARCRPAASRPGSSDRPRRASTHSSSMPARPSPRSPSRSCGASPISTR